MLLAKPDEPLIEHIEKSLKVFSSLRKSYPEVVDICGVPHLWDNLFFAVFLHDFGKIANGFQEELTTGKNWNYRHEILSASFVSSLDIDEESQKAIALSVITHHKDIQELREKYATYPEGNNPGFYRYKEKLQEIDLTDLNNLLDYIPEFSDKYLSKKLNNYHHLNSYEEMVDAYKVYVLPYYRAYINKELTSLHKIYGIFIRGFLIAADHLASGGEIGIKRAVETIENYIQFPILTSVQKYAKKHKGDLFLISPTGSGKTEAALFWAHSNQNPSFSKRTFYILPYTASINYMYKRFINLFGDDKLVAILHGKSSYFIYKFFSEDKTGISYEKARNFTRKYQSLAKKIFKPYKITTPFQIIKNFFNLKGFEQNISEMAGGLFIFDEIHSYDPHTTALIMEVSKFIKENLKGKFLFMTATMPDFLKRNFQNELNINEEIKMEKTELDKFTRHKIKILQGNIWDYINCIKEDIKNWKKVLVVVNTVKQAQDVYKHLEKNVPNSALLHSRFILRDREKIESSLENQNLLVGTQVIEISLNIDYDVLYSEPAPIDALLQRFGRVNRRGEKGLSSVYIFTEGSGISENRRSVYSKERTLKSINVLKDVDILCETIIQEIINEVYKDGYSEDEKRIIKDVSESFQKFYKSNVPFLDSPKKESAFYELFKNVEVIPVSFYKEYIGEIEEKRFFEAMKYIMSIPLNQYAFLKNSGKISHSEFGIFVDTLYDENYGLLINENTNTTIL